MSNRFLIGATLRWPRISCLDQRHNIADFPKPVGDARRHRRAYPQLRVDSDKVVIHEVQRHGVGVVLHLLRKCVREPGEAAHVHPHREVLALHVGRGDVLRIGLAFDLTLDGARADRRAVAALFGLRSRAIGLL